MLRFFGFVAAVGTNVIDQSCLPLRKQSSLLLRNSYERVKHTGYSIFTLMEHHSGQCDGKARVVLELNRFNHRVSQRTDF